MKKTVAFILAMLLCVSVFAEGKFSLTTDFAYYPKSESLLKSGTSFAPITGPYSGVEGRVTGNYTYKIPVPFGDNALVRGNTLDLGAALELSPVSVTPAVSVALTPIAFLKFTATGKIGTGWNLIGLRGLGIYDGATSTYSDLPSFKNYWYEARFQSLFQFDLAAIMPGDWNHVVTMATYEVIYNGVTGLDNQDIFMWQTSGEKAKGLNYYSSIILGYQMPLVLQTVGLQFEFSGYYDAKSYPAAYSAYKGDFGTVSINPVAILKFNENHSLTIQANFKARRSFATKPAANQTNLELNCIGKEWFFNRLAFSYSINF